MRDLNILSSAEFSNGSVYFNSKRLHTSENGFSVISKEMYEKILKPYIKFFKMDALSKLGLLTASLLFNNFDINKADPSEVALIIGNSKSSSATDKKYYKTIFSQPSPAIFVYTLPNILMGEICIKYGFKGQNLFFVSESYDEDVSVEDVRILFDNSTAQYVIAGWVDYIDDFNYNSILYLIGKDTKSSIFTAHNLRQLRHF